MADIPASTLLLGFPDYRKAARRLADRAGIPYADIDVHHFPDGESRIRLPEKVADRVILCRSLHAPNAKLLELELAAATALQLGARRLTLVAPYLCYMRQDTAFRNGEAISQRVVGELLARRFDTVITVDPHLHRVHRLAEAVPVSRAVALTACQPMSTFLAGLPYKPLLIGPDQESEQWVAAIAAREQLDYAIAHKQRRGDRDVHLELPSADYAARHIVLVDDIASTGRSLEAAARQLRDYQPASISVLVTHALFVNDAVPRLKAAGVQHIYSTDSIPHPSNQLPLDGILASAISPVQD